MRGFWAKFSDGSIYDEQQLASQFQSAWIRLKEIAKEKRVKLVELILVFDHQKIFTINSAKVFFYKKRVTAWINSNGSSTQEYGIGASDGDVLTITWYDGENSREEIRKINKNDAGFFFNEEG